MTLSLPTSLLLAVSLAVAVGGLVAGLNGFGFSVVGTGLLAALSDPGTAVALMILPVLAANLSLVRELSRAGLRSCVRRFWPFVAAALGGTLAGMVGLSWLPRAPLTVALGVLVLGYVAASQAVVPVPGTRWLAGVCLDERARTKAALGAVSGLVFGASNVGIQVVAYLRSLDLDRSTFVGVVAMIFLGISTVRVGAALALGLFGGGDAVLLSAGAAVPGLAGVAVGRRLRPRLPERVVRGAAFAVLLLVGLRLTTGGIAAL
jgi:hypothetical protein